jgi:hypothetical protein
MCGLLQTLQANQYLKLGQQRFLAHYSYFIILLPFEGIFSEILKMSLNEEMNKYILISEKDHDTVVEIRT